MSSTQHTDAAHLYNNTRKETENTFQLLVKSIRDYAIFMLDTSGKVISWNEGARQLKGYDEAEILNKHFSIFYTPEDIKESKPALSLKKAAENGTFEAEEWRVKKDGSLFCAHVVITAIYKDSGKLYAFAKVTRDITSQKKAEEKLQISNERFEIVLKATNEAIWDWNLVTGEVYCNDSYEKLFGYKKLIASHNTEQWIKRIHPEDRNRVKDSIMEKINKSDPASWQAEYRFIKENGETADVSDCGFIIFDDKNEPIRFVGAMQDITKRKKTEIEKEYLIDQLTNSYRDLQQFTYITSHNLRGPLSNLIGLLHHIDYTDLADYNKNIIEMFKSSTRQLYETINDLNQVLIIKNKNKLEICYVDVTEVFVNVCRYFADDIEKLPVIIYTDFACKEIPFHKSYLESVLTNLMSNAIKYRSPDRTLELVITTKREKKDYVSLTFADNGIGIDLKRNKDRIFGLYQRFHSNTDGAGFGLYITKTQITSFGGTINVESEPDKGAAFHIEFREKL